MSRNKRLPRELWLELRKEVWNRDKGKCVRCGASVTLKKAHIDHIEPLSRGGSNSLENLRTLCRTCHSLRADPSHRGMASGALRSGAIPPGWRKMVWDD